jgi:ankyrin repeat protein
MRIRQIAGVFCGWFALCSGVLAAANSPAADAAMRGDHAELRRLIEQKVNVNAPQADGGTAMHWAAYQNDLAMAEMLIAGGADVRTPNREGATPLSLAATNGSALMIEKLLSAGADADERGPQDETPLMLASRNGNVDAMKVLLDHKAWVNAKEKLRGTSALMWAAEQGHAAAVKLLLLRGADVSAATNPDTRNARNNVANTVSERLNSSFGAIGQSKARAVSTASPQPAGENIPPPPTRVQKTDGGGLTPLIYAAREDCIECARVLLEHRADVNQRSHYGWTPLLVATQNRHYRLAQYLLEHGANPNIKNNGGWSPLYIATDNRNIESGDYPVRAPDIDHLEFIQLLLAKGADVNTRVCDPASTAAQCSGDTTETRNNFTMQWLFEDGATPFLRAAQSGDILLMKLLLSRGANPKIFTAHNVTPLAVASGIGWVEGVTFEWSEAQSLETVQMCLDLGIDPNIADDEGRTALHGAAHKGRTEVIQLLSDHGARLDAHDAGSRDSINGALLGKTWIPLDWARGLVRVGVQSAIPHPEAEKLLVKLMTAQGLPIPPPPASSICLTKGLDGCQ